MVASSCRSRGTLLLFIVCCLLRGVAADRTCTETEWGLFISLVVYFCVTLTVGIVSALVLLLRRVGKAEPTTSLHMVDGSFIVRGGSTFEPDGGHAGDHAAERESWQINFRDLRFLRRIGVGNVGEVYKGVYRGRPVAIKKLLGSWYRDDDMVLRFREEIMLLSTMNHANVLMFVGAVLDRDAGNICLVTEICERGTLYDLLHSDEPLTWQRRLRMARDVALGMDYLHTKARIIQRDLKSQNLLVGKDYEVKIADFGLSRSLMPGKMLTYCGTPATMAPEVVRQEAYTEKADVYSFSIILWELLTRQEPYPGASGLPLAYAVANDGLRPPIPAYCPVEWAALMIRCWDDDPLARPSFDEIQRTLAAMIRTFDDKLAAASRRAAAIPTKTTTAADIVISMPSPSAQADGAQYTLSRAGALALADMFSTDNLLTIGRRARAAPWTSNAGVVYFPSPEAGANGTPSTARASGGPIMAAFRQARRTASRLAAAALPSSRSPAPSPRIAGSASEEQGVTGSRAGVGLALRPVQESSARTVMRVTAGNTSPTGTAGTGSEGDTDASPRAAVSAPSTASTQAPAHVPPIRLSAISGTLSSDGEHAPGRPASSAGSQAPASN